MILRAQAIWVHYQAWDAANNIGKSGDVANHTLQVVLDGVISPATNSPQAVGGDLYKVLLTTAEVDGLLITLGGVSSTSNIYIMPVHFITSDDTRGVVLKLQYTAWDTSANAPKTTDDANHTLNIATGSTTAGATNTPTELSAVDIPGVYSLELTEDETAEPIDSLYGTSSTDDVVIVPTIMSTGRKYSVITDPSDTLRQRIVDVLTTRLATITIADGFKTDVGKSVHRWLGFGLGTDKLPAVEYKDTFDNQSQGTIGRVDHTLTIGLQLISRRNTEATEDAAEKEIRLIIADINQMIGTDETMSNLAEDTELIDDEIVMEQLENKQWGATISLNIEYRTGRFNSYA
jgi:hypothetical protein